MRQSTTEYIAASHRLVVCRLTTAVICAQVSRAFRRKQRDTPKETVAPFMANCLEASTTSLSDAAPQKLCGSGQPSFSFPRYSGEIPRYSEVLDFEDAAEELLQASS